MQQGFSTCTPIQKYARKLESQLVHRGSFDPDRRHRKSALLPRLLSFPLAHVAFPCLRGRAKPKNQLVTHRDAKCPRPCAHCRRHGPGKTVCSCFCGGGHSCSVGEPRPCPPSKFSTHEHDTSGWTDVIVATSKRKRWLSCLALIPDRRVVAPWPVARRLRLGWQPTLQRGQTVNNRTGSVQGTRDGQIKRRMRQN